MPPCRRERFAHGAAVLLHAAGLRGGDAERVSHLLRVEAEEPPGGGARCDRAERAGEMPAARMMSGRRLADAHAGLESGGISADEIAAAIAAALDQREQGSEDGSARVQHDTAHMGVVIVEHMPHLAVGGCGLDEPELELAAENGGLRLAADRLQHREQLADGRMRAAGQGAADPIEHAAAAFMHRPFGQILELEPRQECAEVPGHVQAEGGGVIIGLGCCLRRHFAQPSQGMNRPPLMWIVWPVM